MNKLEANATLTEFYDYFSPQVDLVSSVGSIRRGEDPTSNRVQSVLLPKYLTYEQQASFIPGVVVGVTKVNLFTKRLKSDLRYQIYEKKKNRLIFFYSKQRFFHDIFILEDVHQFGIAQIFLTCNSAFVDGLKRFAKLRRWHFDTYFRLHQHEQGGNPGARKNCTLGGSCKELFQGSSELDLFEAFQMPNLKMKDRTLDQIKKAEKKFYESVSSQA